MNPERRQPRVEVLPDLAELTRAAAEGIVRLGEQAIGTRGRFSIALSGGSTPEPVYRLLASAPLATRLDWSKVNIFWGDERCVPPDDPQSNYRMARRALLDHVPIPPENVHRVRGEANPELAAQTYAQDLRAYFGSAGPNGPPASGFDLVLLGMGDEGHTASIFPGSPALTETVRWVVADYVAKVGMWRVTLTPVVLDVADNVTFLVAGANKAERVREVLSGQGAELGLPAAMIQPKHGELVWLLDQAAAAATGIPNLQRRA